jgi:hypothetical protein
MKIIKKIDRHEVMRRWAIGEVYSKFYQPANGINRDDAYQMLKSGQFNLERKAIDNVLTLKQSLVDSISQYINWYRADLEVRRSDLDLIYTLQLPGWEKNSKGSFLVADAANEIRIAPNLDRRVTSIYEALKDNNVEMDGITLLAVDKVGPYVAVEGTGRLTAIYIAESLEKLNILENEKLEVTLGLY